MDALRDRFTLDRLVFPVLSVVAAGVLITTTVAYLYTKATVTDLAHGQIAQALAFIDREVCMQARDMVMQTESIAREEVLVLALENSYIGRSARASAQRKLDAYIRNGTFDQVFLFNLEGEAILAGDPSLAGRVNVADRRYFSEAAAGRAALETVVVSRSTGKPSLVMASPLRAFDGTVVGVVAGVTNIETFAKAILEGSHIGRTGGAFITDTDGVVLGLPAWLSAGSLGLHEGGGFSDAHVAALKQSAETGEVYRFTRGGNHRASYSRLNGATHWLLTLEADEGEVLAPARRLAAVSGSILLVTLITVALILGVLRRAMVSLRHSEADQRTLTELSPVGIVTFDPAGRPSYLNRQGRDIAGMTADDPLPAFFALEDTDGGSLIGDDSPFVRVFREGLTLTDFEAWLPMPDGTRKLLSVNATPLVVGREQRNHGVVATFEDVTERRMAQERLQQSEKRFATLFRLSPDSIVLSSFDTGLVVDVNDSFCQLHGLGRDEVVGRSLRDIGLYDDPAQLDGIITLVREKGRVVDLELRARSLKGEELYLSLSSQLMVIGEANYRLTVVRDMTERYRAEQELHEKRLLLEGILDSVPVSIFWKDAAGRFMGCNRTFAQMVGLDTPETVIGKDDADLGLLPGLAETFREADRKVMATLSPMLGYVERLAFADGRERMLETSKLPLLAADGRAVGVLGLIRDITESLAAQEQLRQSEERFSRLFRYSPEAMALVDMADQRFADVNYAFERLTGYEASELVGRGTIEMAFYTDATTRAELLRRIHTEGFVDNYEFEGRTKEGTPMPCSISCSILSIGDRRFILGLVRDITEMKRMQEVMIQTEKMISVGGIAAGIAHEINNPLGIILQAAHNLAQRTRPDFAKNLDVATRVGLDMDALRQYMAQRKLDVFIEDIRDAAVRASAIIRHMLDFSRSGGSKRVPCDVTSILDKAVALAGSDYDLKKSYDFRRITITRDYEAGLPLVDCSPTELEQVLLNLLRNAAHALAESHRDGEGPAIHLRVRRQDETVVIDVQDNGPGIPVALQRRIFEPFYTTKPPGVGTGLGLSVSYFIVTKGHGGNLTVVTPPEGGTLFRIELPLQGSTEAHS